MARAQVTGVGSFRCRQAGQVLVFFALVLPILLLPVAAYAVDAAVAAEGMSRLQEVTARAAEEAAQQVDAGQLRAGAGVALDPAAISRVARAVISAAEPAARIVEVRVEGNVVTVATAETVVLPLNFFWTPDVRLRVAASARLAPGYERPSNLLPLSLSTF